MACKIKRLYRFGARKLNCLAWTGLVPLGSIPYASSTLCRKNLSCVANINNAVQPFNAGLFSLVHQLHKKLNDARFI
uniref:Uncharacterized protein n=1 Tax=Populus trichocarpa TaxID=3694 RepID=U7E0D8_POPTR